MNRLGEELIKAINKTLVINIEINEETTNKIDSAVSDIITEFDFGYCPDCEERRSDGPQRDESRD